MNSLSEAKMLKNHLRFDIGDVVYLKSDLKKKCPLTITGFITMDDDVDYAVTWMNSQKVLENSLFHDKSLTDEK